MQTAPVLRLPARLALAAACLLSLYAPPALAEPPTVDQTPVVISAVRNPELKTYRVMAAGLAEFDDMHALAPNAAVLRFKLRARSDAKNLDFDQLTLRLAGDKTAVALPIAADHSFLLPRSPEAADDNADLVLNKPKGAFRWQPDIHSEGVPAGMRRLGDLRLECRVLIAIGKKELGFMRTALVNTVLLTTDWCGYDKINLPTPSARKIESAALLSGEQRIVLEVLKGGMGFVAPIANKAYPDDTLIEIRFADEADGKAP